ncbi:uncharacterized protein LOC122378910 [Amphibalanus amphitrite]|uniref:uncharacterized protein LOC122378910 n=1 Tax=Amphibalanus amphitrite TaxID=1232801 RepID=UPI001C90227F|nr:uncharacterized protein LOC122378910 [Amphibalanus amphitrite]
MAPMALLEDSLEMLLDAFRQCAGLMLVLGTFTHLCLWLVGRRVVRPRLYFKPSSLSRHLQRHMSALERPFTVPRLLIPRHLQTLLGPLAVAAGTPSPPLLYRRQYLQLRDRCSVPLDWAEPLGGGTADPAARVLLVLPDLLLDDSRLYAPVCRRALAAGCLPVVVNFRQLVRNNLPASRVAALYDVTDLRWVVRYMLAVCPGRRLAAVGFGNGGSLLLAYLGEHGISCQLAAAAVVSPAWSYAAHLLGDACAPYAALTTLREKYRVYRRATDSSTVVGGAPDCDGSFADFHRRVHGDDEERHNPVIDIDEVSVPLLAVHADDDPVYGAAGLPLQLFTAFPHLFLLRAPLGGHCGFYTGSGVGEAGGKNGRSETAGSVSWAADTAVQFIDSVCGFLDAEDAGGAGGIVRAARRVAARVARRSAAAAAPRAKNPGHTSDGGGQIVESTRLSVEDANRSLESENRSQERPTCPQVDANRSKEPAKRPVKSTGVSGASNGVELIPIGASTSASGTAQSVEETCVALEGGEMEQSNKSEGCKTAEPTETSGDTHEDGVSCAADGSKPLMEGNEVVLMNSKRTCVSCGIALRPSSANANADERTDRGADQAVDQSDSTTTEGASGVMSSKGDQCVDNVGQKSDATVEGNVLSHDIILRDINCDRSISDSNIRSASDVQCGAMSNGDLLEPSGTADCASANGVPPLQCTEILDQKLNYNVS